MAPPPSRFGARSNTPDDPSTPGEPFDAAPPPRIAPERNALPAAGGPSRAGKGAAAPRARDLSPYLIFSRQEWAELRADTPLTLGAEDLSRLKSLNEPLSLDEVVEIYLPLSRLLALYVAAAQGLYKATQRFLGAEGGKTPYIIGVAGSVAVGKSTTTRVLKALLSRWPNTPKVEMVTTDGFLHPNAELQRLGLMERKGFPESYDAQALVRFLHDVKAGRRNVVAPVYSHLVYDVVPGETVTVDRPDILIVEGINVLLPGMVRPDRDQPVVSDFFDFSIYLDAGESLLAKWYVERFMRLRETAFRDPRSFFRKYSELSDEQAVATAQSIWSRINLVNLRENVRPTRARASLILTKGASHRIERVALRKL
jgi:type I pantothenate kinase